MKTFIIITLVELTINDIALTIVHFRSLIIPKLSIPKMLEIYYLLINGICSYYAIMDIDDSIWFTAMYILHLTISFILVLYYIRQWLELLDSNINYETDESHKIDWFTFTKYVFYMILYCYYILILFYRINKNLLKIQIVDDFLEYTLSDLVNFNLVQSLQNEWFQGLVTGIVSTVVGGLLLNKLTKKK